MILIIQHTELTLITVQNYIYLKCFLTSFILSYILSQTLNQNETFSFNFLFLQIMIFILIFILFKSYSIVYSLFSFDSAFYAFLSILYLVSLFSSSFIEEEHQIWYFFDTTQIFFLVYNICKKLKKYFDIILMLILLITNRLLRTINQTGNKWVHLKDFGDILRENESKFFLLFFSATCLLSICMMQKFKIINILNFILIFSFHLSSIFFEYIELQTRNLIAQVAYLALIFSLIYSLLRRLEFNIFESIGNFWLLLNCLIHPTHNIITLLLWQIKEFIINKYIHEIFGELNYSNFNIFCFYLITSQSCYFSQGNSNSLNSVQVSSGFVGINQMNMTLIGFLIFSATYSSNVYWFLASLKHFSIIYRANKENFKK